jgi:hypothetical protein
LKNFTGELGLLAVGQENDGSDERDLQGLLDSPEAQVSRQFQNMGEIYLHLQD